MSNVFDIVKSIRNKEIVYEWGSIEKEYSPFLINRALSFDIHSLFMANEMNKFAQIDKKWQYNFLLNTVRPTKKFTPWVKRESEEDIDMLREFYQCNRERAREISHLLSPDHLNIIKQKLNRGGYAKGSN